MKKVLAIVLSLVLAVAIAGCGSNSNNNSSSDNSGGSTNTSNTSNTSDGAGDASQDEKIGGKITLYTSEPQDLVNEMIADFKKKHPGVDVEIFRGGSGQVVSKLTAELQAGVAQADVIWFADIEYFSKLAESGYLEQYDSPNAADLNPRFKYEDGKYYEVRQIFNVIAYNTVQVKEAPKSWHDLYNPDLKGKVAIANPNYSGAAFQTLATFVQDPNMGWDFFHKLKENSVKFEQSNGNLSSKLASGEYAAVSVVDFMIRNAKAEGSPVDVVWPEEGSILIPTPVAIMSSSQNKPAAQALVDYFLSDEGQQFFLKQGYIPVRGDSMPEGVPALDSLKVFPIDLEYIAQNREELKTTFENIFTEAK